MAGRYKPTHQKKKRRAKRKESSFLRTALTLCFCVLAFVFSAFLWREALRVSSQEQGSVSASGEAFRPQVGDPPYRVAIDAGHGGNDPGARGVVEEKDMTAATASVLLAWLEQDPNYRNACRAGSRRQCAGPTVAAFHSRKLRRKRFQCNRL